MQFSAIIAIAFSSAVMASPSFLNGLLNNKVARQECTPTTFNVAACTQGNSLFCSNVNTDFGCPDGMVERFDDSLTRLNEEACAGRAGLDQCTMNVLCCPA